MNKMWPKCQSLCLQLIAMAALFVAASLASAQTQDQDTDRDGFTDAEETAGIVLSDGTIFSGCVSGADRTTCLDPLTSDFFVTLVPASRSLIPSDATQFIRNLIGEGVHEITADQAGPNRQVTASQKAIRITESLDTNDTLWGISLFQGTPNTAGEAIVFTQRISDKINQVYTDAGSFPPPGVIEKCIRHTYAHEGGHNMNIRFETDRSGENHYSTRDQVVMSTSVTIKVKGSNVSVNCPDQYADPDFVDFRLQ